MGETRAELPARFGARRNLERRRVPGDETRVEFVELFFDLVFVFAVTQISHTLLKHLTVAGALQAAMLLMAVWWVWVYTSWVTNWLDPRHGPIRFLLFVLMLVGILLSISIPEAFGERGLMFASAYVCMQIGRTSFMLWALRRHNPGNYRNMCRIVAWLVFSGVFWVAGGVLEGEARLVTWAIALTLDYIAPSLRFWTPWYGASAIADWDVDGGHMAERSGLFVIIALGESIIVTGATLAEAELSTGVIGGFLAAFGATVAMWWIYFNVGAEIGRHRIEAASDPGRLARIAYTYLPLILIAGIIVSAAADELVLAHPIGHHAEPAVVLAIVGGPALYIFGNLVFKWVTANSIPLSHLIGLALLLVAGLFGVSLDPMPLSVITTVILFAVAFWEYKLHEGQNASRH